MSCQLASTLLSTRINNSEIIDNKDKNNEKLIKFNFIKTIHGVEELYFLTLDARRAFS